MAYDKEEIEILRDELGKLLGCLDNIAAFSVVSITLRRPKTRDVRTD